MADLAVNVMASLINKLGSLTKEEYDKFNSINEQVGSMKEELCSMKAVLEKMVDMENLDPEVKIWWDQVRELSYDMEDCVVSFMQQERQRDTHPWSPWGIIWYVRELRQRYNLSKQIDRVKKCLAELSDRRDKYKLDSGTAVSPSVAVDPRLHVLYKDASGLVGTDGQRDKLMKMLNEDDQNLKVVSVVECGGLGKTTLANLVYNTVPTAQHHRHQFDCQAFVSVSQRPDITGLLRRLLKMTRGGETPSDNVQDLIDMLNEHLRHKRYFIVIDDLWNQSDWHIIRSAFPENSSSSRLVVTTRIESVALDCCANRCQYVYRMEPKEEDSRRLFLTRIFGSEDACPEYLKEVLADVLRKCHGLPLAINVVSGFLASKTPERKEHWDRVRNSQGSIDRELEPMKQMSQILNLSYMHLPRHLRPRFLYLGMYREDEVIPKDELVNRWVAEDFVSNQHRQDPEDVASEYFNEPVNRCMIQPAGKTYKDEVIICRVHDMMLEFILDKKQINTSDKQK